MVLKPFLGMYGTLAGLATAGMMRVHRRGSAPETEESLPTLAVIVAMRNEAENLPGLLNSLDRQEYPRQKVDFWIVDDDSSDASYKIAQEFAESHPGFHVLRGDAESPIASPKKRALDTGIRKAQAEWIVTTDADCLPGPDWLRALATFMTKETGMIAGYSPLMGASNLVESFSEGESWSSAALCAAGIGLGYPFNAFGRNLAFRRDLFFEMGGYDSFGNIASGDDDLLLQRVATRSPLKVAFAADPRSFVPSFVTPANRYFGTKARHLSAGTHYAPGWIVIGVLGSGLFISLALWTLLARLGLVSGRHLKLAWFGKWLFDGMMAAAATRLLGDPLRALRAVGAMSLAPFAFLFLWPMALFGNIHWKGRVFKRNRAYKAS